ncbi:MAG: XkdF-like putative serine protease domain-containing protein [Oscillospiraceae bacterium]|jgi:hypothetical protein|nr:XkdF-like putative serine protease domain-containing protein [Oscillospiraceae bacterium]
MYTFNQLAGIKPPDTSRMAKTADMKFEVRKADNEKQQAFGWASVSQTADGETLEDLQGDTIAPDELEQSAYRFVEFERKAGERHETVGCGVLIESCVFTKDKTEAMGIPEGTVPVGWWVLLLLQP